MRIDLLEAKEQIQEWIDQEQSKAFMCLHLNCRRTTLHRYLKLMGITYNGNQGGKNVKKSNKKKSALELSQQKVPSMQVLKKRLIEEKIKKYECESCKSKEWQGVPIPLELHHINGDRSNNTFENIQLLCPNCHALTANYAGRGTIRHCSPTGRGA